MPIRDLGYRVWPAGEARFQRRSWVIADTCFRLAWKNNWLRRMLFVAWMPAVALGFSLFLFERSVEEPEARVGLQAIVRQVPRQLRRNIQPSVLENEPEKVRREVWALILLMLFRYPQALLMVLVVGFVAPTLIASDIRTRAFLLYFSRPMERLDYIIGKSVVVWIYLGLITTLPAMSLYVLGVGLSPDLSVVLDTWDLPLRILLASVWLIIPTTAMALCFSSLTTESRYAAFAWFGVWVLGWAAYVNLSVNEFRRDGGFSAASEDRWTLVSLYHCLGRVQTWVFGLEEDFSKVVFPLLLLIVITLVSLLILFRRVAAPIRV